MPTLPVSPLWRGWAGQKSACCPRAGLKLYLVSENTESLRVPPPEKKPRRRSYHDQFVQLFLDHTKVEDVAKASGFCRKTVSRWKSDPANWSEVLAARSACVEDAVGRLRRSLPAVTQRLLGVALDVKTESVVAVRAAVAAIDAFGRLTTGVAVEQRLTELEALVRGVLPPPRPQRPTLLSYEPTPILPKAA